MRLKQETKDDRFSITHHSLGQLYWGHSDSASAIHFCSGRGCRGLSRGMNSASTNKCRICPLISPFIASLAVFAQQNPEYLQLIGIKEISLMLLYSAITRDRNRRT